MNTVSNYHLTAAPPSLLSPIALAEDMHVEENKNLFWCRGYLNTRLLQLTPNAFMPELNELCEGVVLSRVGFVNFSCFFLDLLFYYLSVEKSKLPFLDVVYF